MPTDETIYCVHVTSKHLNIALKNDATSVTVTRYADYDKTVEVYRLVPPSENESDKKQYRMTTLRWAEIYRVVSAAEVEDMLNAAPGKAVGQLSGVGSLVEPTERDTFDNLILMQDVCESIQTGLKMIETRDQLDMKWGLGKLQPLAGKLALNFYGPPGTGKTSSALCVARQVEKKLYKVDYASMISKWVGDTGKHIRLAFKEAREHGAILFFDEADAMLSKRVELSTDDVSNSVNQNRTILMQELDKFDSIVIFATNLFQNYDAALLRRIAEHIEFKLPDEATRLLILNKKFEVIPPETRAAFVDRNVDLAKLAKEADEFSGSDLENLLINSFKHVGLENHLTQTVLMGQLTKIAKSKKKHKGEARPAIGIGATQPREHLGTG